jgi:hypothetical protein
LAGKAFAGCREPVFADYFVLGRLARAQRAQLAPISAALDDRLHAAAEFERTVTLGHEGLIHDYAVRLGFQVFPGLT